MLKLLVKDSLIYMIPTILSRGITFLLIPVYTRVLSPADYGALDLLLTFGSLINLTVAFEITQGVARFYVEEKDERGKILATSSAMWFSFTCYALFLFVALAFAGPLATLVMGRSDMAQLFGVGCIYLFLNGFLLFVQNQFRWELKSKKYATVSFVMSIVTAAFSILLAVVLKMGFLGLLLGMIAGAVSGLAYGLYHLRASYAACFDLERLKRMLKFSVPLVPSGISVFISLYADRLLLRKFTGVDDVGVYAVAFKVASVLGLLMIGFNKSLTPLVYNHHHEPATREKLAFIFRIFSAFSLVGSLVFTLFALEIIHLVTVPAFFRASEVLVYLTPSVIIANMYILAPGIDLAKRTTIILWLNAAGAAAHVLLGFLLVPRYGIHGAAISTLAAHVLVFVGYMFFSQRFYKVPHDWKPFLPLMIVFVALCYLSGMFHEVSLANFMLKVSALMIFMWCLVICGLIPRHEISRISKFLSKRGQV